MKLTINKKGEMMWYLLALILGLAVIFAIIYFLFIGNKSNWQFLKDLPVEYKDKDNLVGLSDLSEDELKALNCEPIAEMFLANQVASISGAFYFRIGSHETNLYLDEKFFDIKLSNSGIFKNKKIGTIQNGVIIINKEFLQSNSAEFLEYSLDRYKLPSIQELRKLHNSYQLQGGKVWCKSIQETIFNDLDACVESCSLYNGICKNFPSSNEISLGNIDCNKGSCYVQLTEEKLKDGKLKLDKFLILDLENNFQNLENNFDEITLSPGSSGILLSYEISGLDFTCSIIRSNKEILQKNHFAGAIKSSIVFQPSDEKTFEFLAWNKENNLKVLKRIKINLEKPNQYFLDGDFVENSNFKKEVNSNNFKIKNIFYVNLNKILNFKSSKNFPSPQFLRYKIEKINNNEINIYGFYFKNEIGSSFGKSDTGERWHLLDCNNGFGDTINFFSNTLSIKINNIKSTLSETVSQYCEIIK